jgi:hypothetical protein
VPADLAHDLAYLTIDVQRSVDEREAQPAGPVTFPDGASMLDSALAARVVLADVNHCCEWVELQQQAIAPSRWAELIAQLAVLKCALHEGEAEAPR